jgi:diguanylate cyclase (GGDEF)-like protein
MADVDNLKQLNDTSGHETGDMLLKKTAEILRHDFRNEDIIARTGGDEFCIILPGTSRDEALMIIQRIKIKCEFESSKEFPISISFGAAERKCTSDRLKNVLRNAEKAMYRDKRKKAHLKVQQSSSR